MEEVFSKASPALIKLKLYKDIRKKKKKIFQNIFFLFLTTSIILYNIYIYIYIPTHIFFLFEYA